MNWNERVAFKFFAHALIVCMYPFILLAHIIDASFRLWRDIQELHRFVGCKVIEVDAKLAKAHAEA